VAADQRYTGRVTVPVLWDKERHTIVSNESAEILRMFNSAFDGAGAAPGDYYPEQLRADIDALNGRIYRDVNNGVYRAGFATTQAAYEEAVRSLFEALDWLEAKLSRSRYLLGDQLNEADIRLFTTLVRFDAVYHGHFKCNIRRIVDYLALHARCFQSQGCGRDREHASHPPPLLRKPYDHKSERYRACGARPRLFDLGRSAFESGRLKSEVKRNGDGSRFGVPSTRPQNSVAYHATRLSRLVEKDR
jgi:glutathione S-transferase